MKTFEKPLSAQEEKELLIKLREGDSVARNALTEKNMRLVAHIVKKYTSTERDYINEDLISVGTIGLIKAVDSFDIERNVRFSTYAAKCIDNEILMLFRQDKKKEREVSLNEPIGKDKEGNETELTGKFKVTVNSPVYDNVEKIKDTTTKINKNIIIAVCIAVILIVALIAGTIRRNKRKKRILEEF